MKLYLIPRLNYNFSFYDLGISLAGIFRNNLSKDKICKLFDNNDIYFTKQARIGLRILLNSFNLPPGARIGVQIINCYTVFDAIINANFKPIFIDVNDSLTISTSDLRKKADQLDAVIVTHLFGIPAEIEKIKSIVKEKPIIEDCAHSFLSRRNEILTGTFGDAGVYSFGKAKFPSIGDGGFVVINNKTIIPKFEDIFSKLEGNNSLAEINNVMKSAAQKIIHNKYFYKFITFPFIKRINKVFYLNRKNDFLERRVLKSNLSLFFSKIESYESIIEEQMHNTILLKEYLKKFDDLSCVQVDDSSTPNFMMLPVITSDKQKLINAFDKIGVEIGSHFRHSIDWAKELGYRNFDCPNAENIIPKLVVIPTYTAFKFN